MHTQPELKWEKKWRKNKEKKKEKRKKELTSHNPTNHQKEPGVILHPPHRENLSASLPSRRKRVEEPLRVLRWLEAAFLMAQRTCLPAFSWHNVRGCAGTRYGREESEHEATMKCPARCRREGMVKDLRSSLTSTGKTTSDKVFRIKGQQAHSSHPAEVSLSTIQ